MVWRALPYAPRHALLPCALLVLWLFRAVRAVRSVRQGLCLCVRGCLFVESVVLCAGVYSLASCVRDVFSAFQPF